MVARGAGAAGPVLLACCQWNPRGLARRLPSRGAGASRGAPLLPWRPQCPGPVCAALAAASGGLGPVPGVVSPFPPHVSCAVCGGPSCLGVSYPRSLVRHSTRSVRSAGSVRLLFWYSPRVLCVYVRSRSRGVHAPPPPLPGFVWRVHLARSRCWALVGPFQAVRAPPRVLPRSRAQFVLLGGGGGPVPFPLYLAWGCAFPMGWVCVSGAFGRRGVGGGGVGLRAVLPSGAAGGASGVGVALLRSVPLPFLGRQQSRCLWRRPGKGGRGPHIASVRVRLLSPGAVWVASLCAGADSLVHRSSCGSRRLGAWRRALLRPPPPPGAAVLPGGGGTVPSTLGGVGGRRPRGPRVRGGEWGDRGGGWRDGSPPPSPVPHLSPVRVRPGPWGSPRRRARPAAGGSAWQGGGGRGGLCAALPGGVAGGPSGAGGRSASVPPSASPGRATKRVSLPTIRSWRAWAPYCSGSCSLAAPGGGPCVALVR